MQTLESLQSAIATVEPRGRGRRFPAELKAAVVVYIADARARGVTVAKLEADLGVSWNTMARWSKPRTRRKPGPPKAVPVRVVSAPKPPTAATLVSPTGWRIEGLSLEQLRRLVNG
jgi:transposase-like protein